MFLLFFVLLYLSICFVVENWVGINHVTFLRFSALNASQKEIDHVIMQ